jgi:hypothetical protein
MKAIAAARDKAIHADATLVRLIVMQKIAVRTSRSTA